MTEFMRSYQPTSAAASPLPLPPIPAASTLVDDLVLEIRTAEGLPATAFLTAERWKALSDLSRRFVNSKFLANGTKPVWMGDDQQKEQLLCLPETVLDAFGPFTYDPLEGMLSLALVRKNNATFPAIWLVTDVTDVVRRDSTAAAAVQQNELLSWAQRLFAEHKRSGFPQVKRVLEKSGVLSVEEFAAMPDDYYRTMWTGMTPVVPVGDVVFLDKQRKKAPAAAASRVPVDFRVMTERELLSRFHRVKLYLSAGVPGAETLAPIDAEVARLAKAEISDTFANTHVINELFDRFVQQFTQTTAKPSRGCLLFGPPGTGKTLLATEFVKMCGFLTVTSTFVCPGDLTRKNVGETERVVNHLCDRALLAPHCPWIFPIDEIESAVAKRSATDSSGYKSDVVSVFLRRFGEASDVPNLFLVGATNRREAIDTAVVRRMPVHVFVGYPNADDRTKILKSKLQQPPGKTRKPILDLLTDAMLSTLATSTVNFSGAAMAEVARELLSEWEKSPDDNSFVKSFEKTAVTAMRNVAKSLKIEINGVPMPDILTMPSVASKARRNHWLQSIKRCTGLAVIRIAYDDQLVVQHEAYEESTETYTFVEVDLRPKCERCGRFGGLLCDTGRIHSDEVKLCEKERTYLDAADFVARRDGDIANVSADRDQLRKFNAAACCAHRMRLSSAAECGVASSISIPPLQVVRELCHFGAARKLDRVFFININTFMGLGAFNEQAFIEEVDGIARQANAGGSRTMLIFDLDSLAGVQLSSSTESANGADNFSMVRPGLFDRCIDIFLSCRRRMELVDSKGRFVAFDEKNLGDMECWAFCLVMNAYVERCFRKKAGFKPLKHVERQWVEKRCSRCQETFTDANADGCSRHWGSVLLITKPHVSANQQVNTEAITITTLSDADLVNGNAMQKYLKEVDMDPHRNTRMIYSCCGSNYGFGSRCDYRCPHEERPTLPKTILPSKFLCLIHGNDLGKLKESIETRLTEIFANDGMNGKELWEREFKKNNVELPAKQWAPRLALIEASYGLGIPSDVKDDGAAVANPLKANNQVDVRLPPSTRECSTCRYIYVRSPNEHECPVCKTRESNI